MNINKNFLSFIFNTNFIFFLFAILLLLFISLDMGLLVDSYSMTGNELPMSGVRCPTCAANGQEVWVIPGRACGSCGTGC